MLSSTTIGAIAAISPSFSNVFSDIYKDASATLKKYLDKRNIESISTSLQNDSEDISHVRRIFSQERVSLKSFYHPLEIQISNPSRTNSVDCIDHIDKKKNIIIYGTAGQGKSMFMRHLCINEHPYSNNVGFFIELRYIKEDKNLIDLIKQQFYKIGFPDLTDELMIFLLKTGKFSIFLDGVDEVKRTFALDFKRDLEILIGRTSKKCRFTLSSRKGSIANLAIKDSEFIEVSLATIPQYNIKKFLIKMGSSAESADFLYSNLVSSNSKVINILNTPLLLELFRKTYGNSGNIPNNSVEFYKQIFNALIFHHDEGKELYKRERATSLDNTNLLTVFEYFSYFSKDIGISLDHEQFSACSENTMSIMKRLLVDVNFTPEGLKTDITEGLCLMIKEGLETTFIHKSIQEFFTASCLSNLKDDKVLKNILSSLFKNPKKEAEWQEELKFLSLLDKTRYDQLYIKEKYLNFIESISEDGEASLEVAASMIYENIHKFEIIDLTEKPISIYFMDTEKLCSVFIEIMKSININMSPCTIEEAKEAVNNFAEITKHKYLHSFAKLNERDVSKETLKVAIQKIKNQSDSIIDQMNLKQNNFRATAMDLMLG